MKTTPRHPTRKPAPRLLAVLVLQAACWAGAAHAADTTWTGAGAEPWWDIGANWSAGAPASASTNAWLGDHYTAIRSGDWLADSVQGTGTLAVAGGSLSLNGGYQSNIGALALVGGSVRGPGKLVVDALDWQGGTIGHPDYGQSAYGTRLEAGAAYISGNGRLGAGSTLALNGPVWWKPGSSLALGDGAQVHVGAGGWVFDDAATGGRTVTTSPYGTAFINEGAYLKTGRGTTSLDVNRFANRGELTVLGGALNVQEGTASERWELKGQVLVAGGAQMTVQTHYLGSLDAGGQISVGRGKLTVSTAYLSSTADWSVAEGGTLSLGLIRSSGLDPKIEFNGGSLHNNGTLEVGGSTTFNMTQAHYDGTGTLVVSDGATVAWDGDGHVEGDLEVVMTSDQFGNYFYGSLGLDVGGMDDFESVAVDGRVKLGGVLSLDFGPDGPQLGTYRVLTAEGGISGTFYQAFGEGIYEWDPLWQHPSFEYFYQIVYGSNYVDLKIVDRTGSTGLRGVTPVPEPGAIGLMLMGTALLAAVARRRA